MGKSILLVHGRAPKPAKRALRRLWFEALRYGIERDHPAKLAAFDQANLEFIYYGNISNDFLDPEHDVVRDAASRRRTLNKLKQYSKEDFNRRNYNRLDGKSAAKEFLADTFAGLAHFFRVSEPVLEVCRWSTIMSVVNRSGKMSVHERIDIDPERTGKAPSAQRYPGRSDISG